MGTQIIPDGDIPAIVRLGFHSCAGGCNGCLSFSTSENRGLKSIIRQLEQVHQAVCKRLEYAFPDPCLHKLSRADFWAWAALWAVEKTLRINNDECQEQACKMPEAAEFTYKIGRKDCDTSPESKGTDNLPEPTFSYNMSMEYFKTNFGLTPDETVALMGAHTLGGARKEKSGYQGVWTSISSMTSFNNEYYRILADQKQHWRFVANVNKTNVDQKWQANRNNDTSFPGFMLPSDLAMVKNLTIEGSEHRPVCDGDASVLSLVGCDSDLATTVPGGRPVCELNSVLNCRDTAHVGLVKKYAQNGRAWFKDFRAVFMKVLENNQKNLRIINLKD